MIGYYVHHHGLGHLTRARSIAAELVARGREVVGFGSLPAPPDWPGRWVELPEDLTNDPVDPTAGGVLHWAPIGHDGHRRRFAEISRWMPRLQLMVVDVSVEVTLLARLSGVPTAVVAMRGDRSDRPHLSAYDAATVLLAPWSGRVPEQWWPQRWLDKTEHLGAMSRFDHLPVADPGGGSRRVLAVWGAGGSDLPAGALEAAAAATPGWQWQWRSAAEPSHDLWAELGQAGVVVCHAGNNTVAEVAAARRPAVVIAQERPFSEQHHTVAALRRAEVAVALDSWPEPAQWAPLLERAVALGAAQWDWWNPGDGARRAAAAIDERIPGAR